MKRFEAIVLVIAVAAGQVEMHWLLYRERRVGNGNIVANSDFAVFFAPAIIAIVLNTFFIGMMMPFTRSPRAIRYAMITLLAIAIAAISHGVGLFVAFNLYGT